MNLRTYASSSSQLLSSDESGWPEWCSSAVRTSSRDKSLGSLGSGKTFRVLRRPVSAGDADEVDEVSYFRGAFFLVGVVGETSLLAPWGLSEGGEVSLLGGIGAPVAGFVEMGPPRIDRGGKRSFGGR